MKLYNKRFNILILKFVLSLLFLFSFSIKTYAQQDPICKTAYISYRNENNPSVPQNEIYTLNLHDCHYADSYWIDIYYHDEANPKYDDSTKILTTHINVYKSTITEFVPNSIKPQQREILVGKLEFSNFISPEMAEKLKLNGQRRYAVFLKSRTNLYFAPGQLVGIIKGTYESQYVKCKELVRIESANRCPSNCSNVVDAGNDFRICMPLSEQKCAFEARVGLKPDWERDQSNAYVIAISLNTNTLPPSEIDGINYYFVIDTGWYRVSIDDYFSDPISLKPNQKLNIILDKNLGIGLAGNTYTLSLKKCIISSLGIHCSNYDLCANRITFPNPKETMPTIIDPRNAHLSPKIFPSVPQIRSDEYRFIIKPCGPNNEFGVLTAIGCISGNAGQLVATFLRIGIGIAGGIAFLLIIFGGLRIILSSGHPEAMMEGKEIVTSAIVGLLLIIFSVFLLRFIGVDVLKLPGFSAEQTQTSPAQTGI